MLRCPSLAIPRGSRRWLCVALLLLLPVILTLLAPFLAQAQVRSAFEERGPAAQDSGLAERAEVGRFFGNFGNGSFDFRVYDCDGGAPCTLDGDDLVELDVSAQVVAAAANSTATQVGTASGRFSPLLPGGDQLVFASVEATSPASAVVSLELCSQTGGDPCPGNDVFLAEGLFAASDVVAVFGDDGIKPRRFVQVTAAQLDFDPLDELVLAYWRADTTIAVEVFDWDPVTGVRSHYVLPASDRTPLDPAHFRSALIGLAAADFDGNLLDSIVIVTPNEPAPLPRQQTNDFQDFRVDFVDFLVSSSECVPSSPCLVSRGSDLFSQHRYTGTPVNPPQEFDHLTRFFPANSQGRTVGCQILGRPDLEYLDCYLNKIEVRGARLTPSPGVQSSFETALPESLLVIADYIYNSENFRQTYGDLITMRPARCGSPPPGQPTNCDPGAGNQDFYLAHLPACDVGAQSTQLPAAECQKSPKDDNITNSILRHVDTTSISRNISFFQQRYPQNNPFCLATGDLAGSPLEEIAIFRSQNGVVVFEPVLAGADIVDVLPQNPIQSFGQGQLPVYGYADLTGLNQGDCVLGIVDLDGDPDDPSESRLSSWDREIVATSVVAGINLPGGGIGIVYEHADVIDVWRVNLTEDSEGDPGGDFVDLTLTSASRLITGVRNDETLRPVPILAGAFPDWDGDALRLGEARVVLDTTFEQPTLILSAPPRHLDLLDELDTPPACLTEPLLDVNWAQCDGPEGNGTCDGLVTRYFSQTSESYGSRIENTVTRSVGGGFSVGPFGASVDRKYTDTDITSGGDSLTQTSTQDADYVDAASARETQYRVYEYELFLGGELMMDDSVPPRPVTVTIVRTLPSFIADTSVLSNSLVLPRHVKGNLLSYKPLGYFINGTGECCSLGDPTQPMTYTPRPKDIGALPDGNWTLRQEILNGTESTTGGSLVFQAGGSASYYGVGVSFSGSYESSSATTHTTDVNSAVEVGWAYTNESSSSALPYTVTAFVRIDPTGAVVLDYAVDIINDPKDPNCLNTVYRLRPDPAIALPRRRNFAQFGNEIRNDVENLQTKELACSYEPSTETFSLQARVHNYSLGCDDENPPNCTPGPAADVQFWLGDPRDPSNDAVLLAEAVAPPVAPQDDVDNASHVDVVVPGAVSAFFICDGNGDQPEGTSCLNEGDEQCGEGGACVPTLGAPYRVCDLRGDMDGVRCQSDADCGPGSFCNPENRLFARIDPSAAISELSEDNNLGWRFLGENCIPEQTVVVPEPALAASMLAALATLAGLRAMRRRRSA